MNALLASLSKHTLVAREQADIGVRARPNSRQSTNKKNKKTEPHLCGSVKHMHCS